MVSILAVPHCLSDCASPNDVKLRVLAGVYLFFIFFGLGMLLMLGFVAAVNLVIAGYVPKLLLVYRAHGIPLSKIVSNLSARRRVGVRV